jgi:hypothetical protein
LVFILLVFILLVLVFVIVSFPCFDSNCEKRSMGSALQIKEKSSKSTNLELTCIVASPRAITVDSIPDPLRYDIFLAYVNWAPRVLSEAIIRKVRQRVHVAEIDGSSSFWLDMNSNIAEVGVASTFWDGAVDEHEKS